MYAPPWGATSASILAWIIQRVTVLLGGWMFIQSYDTFLAGFTHVHRNENDVRRGLLQIRVANTDTAVQSGAHWFVVAWLI